MILELVDLLQVGVEQQSDILGRTMESVYVDFLGRIPAVIRTQANYVPLIGDHVVELVLSKEPLHGGEPLAATLARLNRDRQVVLAGKAATHADVCDLRTHPIHRN